MNNEANTISHNLPLAIADELNKMEANLSHISSETRGHKQLCQCVKRMKDTLAAYGYEMVGLLGKPYADGMRVRARFIIDEKMDTNDVPRITAVDKPQVNYQGHIIQVAEVTVSQPL